ncbi:MAG TPA: DUF559 domain-containing protein [Candidatus Dormibacteraeota bacterium]|nr:DUF559 domain-containing protein [Candidatus Dormibacteraeota bacterium]
MGRKPVLPSALLGRPFTIHDAKRAGIGRAHLRGASWTRVGPGTYAWARLEDDSIHELQAARYRLPDCAAFSGLTAAWLHGIDVAPCNPIEATVPDDAGVSARSGLFVRRATLDERDVVVIRGVRATTIARTVADLSARLSLTEAVVIADAALHERRVTLAKLESWARSHARRRGIRRLRRVIELAEPASESPMESRLRMVLVMAGLPRPMAQVSIHDRFGEFAGRPDLYYETQRLGIEYDGDVHRSALAADNQRQNKLLNAGVRLLRFTASDVLGNPAAVVAHVRTELRQSPADGGYSRR